MNVRRVLGIVTLTIVTTACGSSSTTKPADGGSTSSTVISLSTGTTIAVSATTVAPAASLTISQTNIQKVLADAEQRTLYSFSTDGPNATESKCNEGCATIWPPAIVTGTPNAGPTTAKVGTIKRSDGTLQLTINGRPAYTYAGDTKPGNSNGQNVGGVWFMFDEFGEPITFAPPQTGLK